MRISVVIPLYKCEPFIDELTNRLEKELQKHTKVFEVILVNDASPIGDWNKVESVAKDKHFIKGINLSRNFGQHYAIHAGLAHASGDWIVVMDGDLQDQPEEITKLLSKGRESYDIVFAKRKDRQDKYLKKLSSLLFYRALAYLTDTEQNAEIANFGLYHRKVVDSIIAMGDSVRYFPTMVRWVGFKSTSIYVEHASRSEGETSYNLRTLFRLAMNVILSFSDKPLRLTVKLGLMISLLSVLAVVYYVVMSFYGQIEVVGFTSLIVSIWLLSGIIITLIGMVGLYVGKIFDQVKARPNYIIGEKINI